MPLLLGLQLQQLFWSRRYAMKRYVCAFTSTTPKIAMYPHYGNMNKFGARAFMVSLLKQSRSACTAPKGGLGRLGVNTLPRKHDFPSRAAYHGKFGDSAARPRQGCVGARGGHLAVLVVRVFSQ